MAGLDIKIRDFTMKIRKNTGKEKKKRADIDPNWSHILKEPYCMIKTYRGLRIGKKGK